MPTGKRLLSTLAVLCALSLPARAADRLGIVLVHGKSGLPQQLMPFAEGLAAQGHLTEQPEMCWSRNRIYDRLYLDCLRDIDAAAGRLKARGANAIVVLGMSLGGNAALSFGATRPGLKGVIALAPAHSPEFISLRPEVAASLAQAHALIAAGQGNIKTTFADVNTHTSSFNFSVRTTPNIYVSFFAPDSPAVMPANAARLKAPLLYVTASNDPTQRGREYIFARVPAHPLNRYVVVNTDHIGTPAVSHQIVLSWLKELAGP
jgi:dienelactone hydrolase